MMNFCLYPGTYQPSGHINVSRAREFYLQFVSSYCGSATQCDLLVLKLVQKSVYKIHTSVYMIINQIYARFPNCGEVLKYSILNCQVNGLDNSKNVNYTLVQHVDARQEKWIIRSQVYIQLNVYRCSSTTKCESVYLVYLRYSLALCESNRDQPWRSPSTSCSSVTGALYFVTARKLSNLLHHYVQKSKQPKKFIINLYFLA
jgi:hypothetical protein